MPTAFESHLNVYFNPDFGYSTFKVEKTVPLWNKLRVEKRVSKGRRVRADG